MECVQAELLSYFLPNAHFIVYANKADWLAEKNPLLDSRMDSTGKITISGDKFVLNKVYYYDVYTDNGRFSN